MADLQMTVGGNALDAGTSAQKIFGQPVNERSITGGIQIIQVSFHLQAATADALQTLWGTIKTNFNTQDATVTLTYDSAAGTTMETYSKGQDEVVNIKTAVRQSANEPSSPYSMECILDVLVNLIPETPSSGLIGDVVLSKSYSDGRVQARTLSATYKDAGGADALANYTSARSGLLTNYLGVDSDGGRNSSTGLALTGENLRQSYTNLDASTNERVVAVLLTAEEIPNDYSSLSSLRSSEISIGVTTPQAWLTQDPVSGGIRPTLVKAAGAVTVDKDVQSNLSNVWSTIEKQVTSLVEQQSGKSGIELTQKEITINPQMSIVQFSLIYLADNLTVFDYSRVDVEQEDAQFVIFIDSDGYEVVQKRPGQNPLVRTISVNRTGIGRANIFPAFGGIDFNLARNETGDYVLSSRQEGEQGPFENEFGTDVYVQQGTYGFRRINFKFGDQVSVTQVGV